MKWPKYQGRKNKLTRTLSSIKAKHGLEGIESLESLDVLVLQILASIRREDYYRIIQRKRITADRTNPHSTLFDADQAIVCHLRNGNMDEAAWLVFLVTYFAKHPVTGWRRLKDVYGMLGKGIFTWEKVKDKPYIISEWLKKNWQLVGGNFGNHRKYESLRPDSNRNTGKIVANYINWIGGKGHFLHFDGMRGEAGNDVFDYFYENMKVMSFGRLGKFDYLMALSRHGIVSLEPISAYLGAATGPKRGVSLLLTGSTEITLPVVELQNKLDDLDTDLKLGMAILEDSLCNWQKSPNKFIHFKG